MGLCGHPKPSWTRKKLSFVICVRIDIHSEMQLLTSRLGIATMLRTMLALLFLASLSGCGRSEPDRATGGAATGAGTGAVIGLVGGPVGVVVGALIGGGVGAATGAAVPAKHIDLGTPPWSSDQKK
jgi:hypothetical protein